MIIKKQATLEKMDETNFNEFKEWVIQEYAMEKIKAGNWAENEALFKATEEIEKYFPQGIKTHGQYVYYILNEENIRVGHIWHEMIPNKIGWIHGLLVYENFRRQGYACKAIELIEKILLKNGFEIYGLHVFRHNKSALDLYNKLGFYEHDNSNDKNVYMLKDLKNKGCK